MQNKIRLENRFFFVYPFLSYIIPNTINFCLFVFFSILKIFFLVFRTLSKIVTQVPTDPYIGEEKRKTQKRIGYQAQFRLTQQSQPIKTEIPQSHQNHSQPNPLIIQACL